MLRTLTNCVSRELQRSLTPLLLILFFMGCQTLDEDEAHYGAITSHLEMPAPLSMAETPRPEELEIGSPRAASSYSRMQTGILQVFGTESTIKLAQTTTGIVVLDPASGETSEFGFGPRWIDDVVDLGNQNVLIAGEEGIYVTTEDVLSLSPLSDALGNQVARDVTWTAGSLFFRSGNALMKWSDGELSSLVWPGIDEPWREIYAAPCLSASEGLVLLGDVTVCVDAGSSLFELTTYSPYPMDSLAWTLEAVWGLSEGRLHRRNNAGAWPWVQVPERVSRILGHPEHPALWIQGASSWWMLYGATLSPLSSIDPAFEPAFVNSYGQLEGIQNGSWTVYSGTGTINITGIEPGGTIYEPTSIEAAFEGSEEPTEWKASVNGVELALESNSWVLLPDLLGMGTHTLTVTAFLPGNAPPVSSQLSFAVNSIPTWSDDIEGIYVDKCSLCHEPGVTTFPLHTPEAWQYNSEDIVLVLEDDIMPLLPILPLSSEEKERVYKWMEFGFLP